MIPLDPTCTVCRCQVYPEGLTWFAKSLYVAVSLPHASISKIYFETHSQFSEEDQLSLLFPRMMSGLIDVGQKCKL